MDLFLDSNDAVYTSSVGHWTSVSGAVTRATSPAPPAGVASMDISTTAALEAQQWANLAASNFAIVDRGKYVTVKFWLRQKAANVTPSDFIAGAGVYFAGAYAAVPAAYAPPTDSWVQLEARFVASAPSQVALDALSGRMNFPVAPFAEGEGVLFAGWEATAVDAAPVTGLSATPNVSGAIDIAWTNPTQMVGATGYGVGAPSTLIPITARNLIERSDDGGILYVPVGNVPGASTSFSDLTVVAGTAYKYRVRRAVYYYDFNASPAPDPPSPSTPIDGYTAYAGPVDVTAAAAPPPPEAIQFWGSVPGGVVRFSQWTLMKNPGRVPVLRLKDTKTVHYTYECGQPGVSHSLKRDMTMAANVIFGEGTNVDHCHWRNSVYPGSLSAYTSNSFPLWFRDIRVGTSGSDVSQWEQQMAALGYAVKQDGIFDAAESAEVTRFQIAAGLTERGYIGPQTWIATFDSGRDSTNSSPYINPLIEDITVAPYLRNADGSVRGPNPSRDPRARRVSRFNNFGVHLSKAQATQFSRQEKDRESAVAYVGSMTIKVDAPERHRLEMKAGMNILYKNFRGADHLFHVARATVNMDDLSVAVDVDENARDRFQVLALLDRRKDLTDPAKRPVPTRRHSYLTNDVMPEWDCESGAGRIPTHAVAANTWSVLRIPAGRAGNIVRAEIALQYPARFSCALFDTPTTPSELVSWIPNGPLAETGGGQDPWDLISGIVASGLIVAWGGPDQAAGYYPYRESDGAPVTGVLKESSQIYFESRQSPWLWFAVWTASTNQVSGRFYPQAVMF